MLNRKIVFAPAWDKRSNDPHKNYGIHSAEMRWFVFNDKGAVQFIVYTNWHLPHVQAELDNKPKSDKFPHLLCHPQPADVGYHSPVPQYDGQTAASSNCEFLGGKPCYYDGSGLQAIDIFNTLVAEGSEAVWKELERRHEDLFGKED